MGANDRIVQHLRLRAPSPQVATRAMNRLEDALRCASLPDTGERLLLVRRLDLGKLPAGLSSQSLSMLIEQRVTACGGHWVHGGLATAAESETVFFSSRWQAAQAALLRRASKEPLRAWYWPLALPGVVVAAEDVAFLDSLLMYLAREVDAAVGLPALLAQLVQAQQANWLLAHMSETSIRRVLERSGAQRFMAEVAAWVPTQPTGAALRYQLVELNGAVQQRSLPASAPDWLHAVLRAANWRPVPLAAVAADQEPAQDRAAPIGPLRRAPHGAVTPGLPHLLPQAMRDTGRQGRKPGGAPSELPPASKASEPAITARQVDEKTLCEPPIESASNGSLDQALPTQAGGLLFLLHVLERLGFSTWQAGHPDAPLAGLVLRCALERLRLPEEDPAWALVQSLPRPPSVDAIAWTAPECWREARIALAQDPDTVVTPETMAARWLTACRHYLRRVARIGLASLCLRRARVCWSLTHLDVRFVPLDADMRVRRAGLDIDPGWLIWLERAVSFHYRLDGSI
jgi:hypothetical protein